VQQNVQMTIDLIPDSSDSAADRGEYRQAAGVAASKVIHVPVPTPRNVRF
jgi:hypothetical protein